MNEKNLVQYQAEQVLTKGLLAAVDCCCHWTIVMGRGEDGGKGRRGPEGKEG